MHTIISGFKWLACLPVLWLAWAPSGHTGRIGQGELLKCISGGHALGFGPGRMWAGTGDHVLQVEQVGARKKLPQDDANHKQELKMQGQAPALQKVVYQDAWPGVDVEYATAEGAVAKSTYRIKAGLSGDPVARIRMRYNRPVGIDEAGNLVIKYEHGEMREAAPIAWQEREGKKRQVLVEFQVLGEREIGFSAAYDPQYPLVIDPVMTWNTFLGGSNDDYGQSIAVDDEGNVYVGGYGDATWGAPVQAHSGSYDAFAAKLNSSGTLLWNTFLGGSDYDRGYSIAVDEEGNVYVGGYSYATWGAPIQTYSGNSDAFAAKLNSSGTLCWNTFLGGSHSDCGQAIAVDEEGNVYVGGYSYGTWGAPVQAHSGSYDAFAAKLNSSGTLLWNTFLGGSEPDRGYSIAVDEEGNVYVGGYSYGTWGAPVQVHSGSRDAFAAKLNSSGTLLWNTFLGGSNDDCGQSIAVDGEGNVNVGGYSYATWGTPVQAHSGNYDAFAAKLNSSGILLWSTFLGGSNDDYGHSIVADGEGNVYVGGFSHATWGAPVQAHSGSGDASAAKLNSSGTLLWNTFLGGSNDDLGYSIVADEEGNVYVGGSSYATWGAPIRTYSGNYDAFVARILPNVMLSSITKNYAPEGSNISFIARGGSFTGVNTAQLKNSKQTVDSANLHFFNDSELMMQFNLPASSGLFDLVLKKNGRNYVFRTIFTSLSAMTLPWQWQVNDLGQAGHPPAPGPSAIAIADADQDGSAEVYVADNEHTLYRYKKNSTWTIETLPGTPSDYFHDLLVADANYDGEWEIYSAGSKPEVRQIQFTGTYWNSKSIGGCRGPLAAGDGDHNGTVDIYALSGSAPTGIVQVFTGITIAKDLGTVLCLAAGDGDHDQADEVYAADSGRNVYQFKYNGSNWDKTVIAVAGNDSMTDLTLGDVDKDGNNELYGANQDKDIYQFKWNGTAWKSQTAVALPAACRAMAISDADHDGQDEIYAACGDGHVYQLRLNGTDWQQEDLGNAGTPLSAIAVGDGDNNFQFEVYAVGENAHVYQFQAAVLQPQTPAISPETGIALRNTLIRNNQACTVNIHLKEETKVCLKIYNLRGELVAVLINGEALPAGDHQRQWRGKNDSNQNVASGIYLAKFRAGACRQEFKIAVVR